MKYADTQLTKIFYSNCLIEAIKAKIKDPKHVKLLFIPKKYNEHNSISFHCFWMKDDIVYDFRAESFNKKHLWQLFLFKGHIRANEKKYYERIMRELTDNYCKKLSENLGKKLYFKDQYTENTERANMKLVERDWFKVSEIPESLEGEEVEIIYKNRNGKRCITYGFVKNNSVNIGPNKVPLFVKWSLSDPEEDDDC